MLHVIAVDDEPAALKRFERMALENKSLSIDGLFQYVDDVIAYVKNTAVDVAFLDIEMPEMSGLDLAEILMEIRPYLKVVFITAFDQYAMNAFRAHAIGYLLKPLDSDEFSESIDHLVGQFTKKTVTNPKQLHVTCFGQFSVSLTKDTSSPIRWKTTKAEELFALLIHNRGRVRFKGILIDTLWPELEPQKAANLFRVTCTYLRSALSEIGFSNILIRELDGYKVNISNIDCDFIRFKQIVDSKLPQSIESLEEATVLYSGEYLEGRAYEWASAARIELDADLKKLQFALADMYLAQGQIHKASLALTKVLQHDPSDEDVVTRVIQIKLKNGDISSATRIYKDYERLIKKEFGVLPSKSIQSLLAEYIG